MSFRALSHKELPCPSSLFAWRYRVWMSVIYLISSLWTDSHFFSALFLFLTQTVASMNNFTNILNSVDKLLLNAIDIGNFPSVEVVECTLWLAINPNRHWSPLPLPNRNWNQAYGSW